MRALFIGLGSIGQRHLRNLLSLAPTAKVSALRHSRTVPVLSENNQVVQGADIVRHYGITEFDSLEVSLSTRPDLIFITNPSNLHCEMATLALDTQAFIFIEKPLSNDWRGVEQLAAKERATGVQRIAVGYQFRFHPALRLVSGMLKENRIGRIVGVRLVNGEYLPGWHPYEDYRNSYAARRDLGGGALVTQIHDFDYAMSLFGNPNRIFAVGGQLSSLEVDVEDSVQVLMSCNRDGNVFPVSISQDYLQWPPQRGFAVVGDQGRIDCDLIRNVVTLSNRTLEKEEHHEFPGFVRNEMFMDVMRNFLAFAAGEEEPAVDLACGMASLKVALAARKSMEQSEVISLNWT
jgi:predicted dehydrogenase